MNLVSGGAQVLVGERPIPLSFASQQQCSTRVASLLVLSDHLIYSRLTKCEAVFFRFCWFYTY